MFAHAPARLWRTVVAALACSALAFGVGYLTGWLGGAGFMEDVGLPPPLVCKDEPAAADAPCILLGHILVTPSTETGDTRSRFVPQLKASWDSCSRFVVYKAVTTVDDDGAEPGWALLLRAEPGVKSLYAAVVTSYGFLGTSMQQPAESSSKAEYLPRMQAFRDQQDPAKKGLIQPFGPVTRIRHYHCAQLRVFLGSNGAKASASPAMLVPPSDPCLAPLQEPGYPGFYAGPVHSQFDASIPENKWKSVLLFMSAAHPHAPVDLFMGVFNQGD